MKSIMLSVQPKWVEKIISGEKTMEVRKTVPKIETPFKCYIYCTKALRGKCHFYDDCFHIEGAETNLTYCGGKIVGEFTCDNVSEIKPHDDGYGANSYTFNKGGNGSCLSFDELNDYLNGRKGYAWHISDLKIYDKPKEISEFKNLKGESITRAFQSWGYINA